MDADGSESHKALVSEKSVSSLTVVGVPAIPPKTRTICPENARKCGSHRVSPRTPHQFDPILLHRH